MSDETRQRILKTALAKVRLHGARRVTMDDVATSLHMSKKTLYRYFASKEALVGELAEATMGKRLEVVLSTLATSRGTALERFSALRVALKGMVTDVIPPLMADVRADYPAIWESMEKRRRRILVLVGEVINQGVESGEVRPEINPDVAAGIFSTVVRHYMVPETFVGAPFSPLEALNSWYAIFFGGLFGVLPGQVDEGDGTEGEIPECESAAGEVRS